MPAPRKARTSPNAKSVSPEQIEREAVHLFSEETYLGVSMRDLSDAVGLVSASLYSHIKSKEELLLKIVQDGIARYLDGLTPIAESGDPAATRLRRLMLKYMEILDADVELTRVAHFQWRYLGEPGRSQVIELRKQYRQLFMRVVDEGIAAGEFTTFQHQTIVVTGVMGLLNSTMHWYSPNGPVSAGEIGEQMAEFVLRAVASSR